MQVMVKFPYDVKLNDGTILKKNVVYRYPMEEPTMSKVYLKELDGTELVDGTTGIPSQVALYSAGDKISLRPDDLGEAQAVKQVWKQVQSDDAGSYVEAENDAEVEALATIAAEVATNDVAGEEENDEHPTKKSASHSSHRTSHQSKKK